MKFYTSVMAKAVISIQRYLMNDVQLLSFQLSNLTTPSSKAIKAQDLNEADLVSMI
jgi:hypothetical protein